MSTRCQVRVGSEGLVFGNDEKIMLYHHCDGYPTHMLPELLKGYNLAIKPNVIGGREYDKSWEAGRPGKAAAYMIAIDPGGFEPETGTEFHGDIAYFYDVTVTNPNGGAGGKQKPRWIVHVYRTTEGFWDSPNTDHMELIAKGFVDALAKRAKRLEEKTA